MDWTRGKPELAALVLAVAAMPVGVHAQQKSAENAVTSADDAFGTSVGLESTGIYSERNARGFNPLDAGNARLDGIYFDPVSLVTLRVRASQSVRIGYAALEYPFPAPTGIVDDKLRTASNDFHAGVAFHLQQYGSYVAIADLEIPLVENKLALAAGASTGHAVHIDGATGQNYSFAVKPVIRLGGTEISPFYSANYVRDFQPRQLVISGDDFLPELPKPKTYYGVDWSKGNRDNINYGVTLKSTLADGLSLRAGLFRSEIDRKTNFTEYFAVLDHDGSSIHGVIADPPQNLHSLSGEAQLAYSFGAGSWHHRLIAGFRGRDRFTEFGGSQSITFGGTVPLGVKDPQPIQEFDFIAVNHSKVKQTALMLGYLGRIDGVGLINLGIQKASFRGSAHTESLDTRERENPWLYNASVGIDITPDLMLYGGTQRGLEDFGSAPERATNRNEQLPPARSTQYEAGLSWHFGLGHAVVSLFQITKPYYSFDNDDNYVLLGTVRHRGIEGSLSGHFFNKRLTLLIGAMVMKPRVSGPGVEQGSVGKRPVGTRGVRVSLDTNYRTDFLNGFTPTFGIAYRGKTVAVSRPYNMEGDQVILSARGEVNLGFRQPVKLGRYPATILGKVENLFDEKHWLALASKTLIMSDRRRFTLAFLVDF